MPAPKIPVPCIVVSAERSEHSAARNAVDTRNLHLMLAAQDGLTARYHTLGRWQGRAERGVLAAGPKATEFAFYALGRWGQDCFLYIDAERCGWLVFPNATRQRLGPVAEYELAPSVDGWTYVPDLATHFVAGA